MGARPPSHATVYVPPPLPRPIREGHTLTAEDAYLIEKAIARRDQQIKFLYERELGFARLLDSRLYRTARAMAAPWRKPLGK